MAYDFNWLVPIVIVMVVVFVIFKFFQMIAQATGLDKLLQIFFTRRKPVDQKREDYDALFIYDLKRGASQNKVPAKHLYVMDPKDLEHPWIYYGKIKGMNLESDVVHILRKRRFAIFSDLLFLPHDRISDPLSKELYAGCVGFVPVNRWFWYPIWGSSIRARQRDYLEGVIDRHIDALYLRFGRAIAREEKVAQTIGGMEPTLEHRRIPPIRREPEIVQVPKVEGEEVTDR